MPRKRFLALIVYRMLSIAGIASLPMAAAYADDGEGPFLPRLVVSSTIPANGDLNSYGVAFVPQGFPGGGSIAAGDVLISNFNNSSNVQGTGTTIVKLTPNGTVAPSVPTGSSGNAITFFASNPTGLSTALGVLEGGFVLVGNVPTTDGSFATISHGSVQIINRHGKPPSSRFRTSNSKWEVTKGGKKFSVIVWINHLGQQDYNICFVNFLSNNVNREEFLGFVVAS